MQSTDLRKKYLGFFEARGHKIVPSASLAPEGDATTLFTGSGMQPMMPYLLGAKHPLGSRIADAQKCFRAEDIDEVGDSRHTTFFEMLGNWSFGDPARPDDSGRSGGYWKEDQLTWIFEFLTDELGIDPHKLFVTVFSGDHENSIPPDAESPAIWKKLFTQAKVSLEGRIYFHGSDKNWWSRSGPPAQMPLGEPGGPDSEIFYDFGTKHDPILGKECHPNCECGRFMEIGNAVFMEYVKTEKGFAKLKQRNVDFGGGLERILAAVNNNPDVFQIDVLQPVVNEVRKIAPKIDAKAEQIIADHIRAAVFLIADGIIPSNKDRGYMVRRLVRRAITHAKQLGINQPFTTILHSMVVKQYLDDYPELADPKVETELEKEELKFRKTLGDGLRRFDEVAEEYVNGELTDKLLMSHTAFDLYQTHGLPLEVIKELAKERGFGVDESAFAEEFKKHQELSRTASAGQFKGGLASHSDKIVRLHTATHLLNAALRKVLGEHVWQKGSNITEERTRFDFTHERKMTDEEKKQVEDLVNEWIQRDLAVKKEILPLSEARRLGAIGVFGEKYPDTVSVYTIYDTKSEEVVSREFCGGPHMEHTGPIGKFQISKEEASSAGIRRIKAVIN